MGGRDEGGGGRGGRVGGGSGGGGMEGGELVESEELDDLVDDAELLLDLVDNLFRLSLLKMVPKLVEFWAVVRVEEADDVAIGAGI